MIGRILFLSAAAYAGYWYVRHSTRRAAREIEKPQGKVEILAPELPGVSESARMIPSGAAVEPARQLRSPVLGSKAAEPEPNR
jgi:hypothetical protein